MTFTGEQFLTVFTLPNFYFHVTTAYAILRHAGVALGKMDYIARSLTRGLPTWRRGLVWRAVVITPLLAHAPELLGCVSTNPIFFVSGLGHFREASLMAGLPWIDPNTGYTTQALGAFSARQLLHGHIAWWNPYTGVGLPAAAELQSGALFFPFVLLPGAFDGVLALKIVLQTAGAGVLFLVL